MRPSSSGHLAHLDGLRAVAVLLVVLHHAGKYTLDPHQGWTYHALAEGSHGVDLFFVISGFCLAYPLLKHRLETGAFRFDLARFFGRRIVRIVPAYWVAFGVFLTVALTVVRFGGDLPWPTIKLPSFWSGVNQLFFLNSTTNLCGAFWTLAVEFRWYIIFPLALWLYARAPAVVWIAGAASALGYRFVPGMHVMDFATLPAFLMGIIAADASLRKTWMHRYAAPLFIAAVAASLWLEPKVGLIYIQQDQIWWQGAAFFFVLAGDGTRLLRSALSHPWIVAIGVAAYSIYLYHDPVEAWGAHYGMRNTALVAIAGLLAGALGWIIVERYFTDRVNRDRLVLRIERVLRSVGEPISRLLAPLTSRPSA